ncbi:MAG: DUF817 domain-containing protein [Alphaproteobacteria bacterium]|nr:MAG: DUF817 domain-containing protein [Alphaproteobacteria bacterium]
MKAALREFWQFGLGQAWACLFGGLLLAAILATKFWWPADAWLARYDFLFLYALTIQILLLAFRLESLDEAKVIFIFHVVGTGMEYFKTGVGSWIYPEENLFRLGGVPLFSGFMYASIGSYLARIWRAQDFRYSGYPPNWQPLVLGLLIYVNFFSHHYLPDMRYALFGLTVLIFRRAVIYFTPWRIRCRMPVLLALFLGAFFIWVAENVGTFAGAWLYPNQLHGWSLVPLSKFGSWFLLMILSGALLTLVQKPKPEPKQ